MSVTLKDFYPINKWKPDLEGEKWNCCSEHKGQARHLIDQTTGRKYLNQSKGVVRFKCFLLTLGTPFVHPIAGILNVAYRALKLISLSHFWIPKKEEKSYGFKARVQDAGKDLLRIVAQPLAIVGLELAAIYGLIRPYDGRKLYASIERAQYGNFILAPCFQPDAEQHLLGGDPNKKNAF